MADTRDFEVLTRAHSYLGDVVAAVPESAWGAPTPCTEWTVRQVLNHARIDQQGYGLALTGGRPDSDPFHPADALDGNPAAELGKVLGQVAEAYAALPADAEQVPTPLGPLSPPLAAAAAAMDAAVHAWDIAVATGQDRPLDVELAEGIWPVAERLVDHLRDSYQVFAPARRLPYGHDRAEALLAFLGRDPRWTP
ncbi:TIGR03086 family metal-binding protein [Streptomyces sp. NPDC001260]|uniref:TIGR03086 family metal-binding protein n=1 Tax=Streptomyces gilvifuscus TaxID=1550617 RepID=A0ABT5FPC6_9ACTN|nr:MULTISPECIES: TIGR03086 family metal-binding protein [Streptomyces]MBK3644244.1 TIGR03086 family protein [Streptomyces sp. MBT33]MDC2954381.1 TIGR03086 family metal-binding protein [Streptomyces gilvifuscus]